jgi:hypothetical protein
MMASDAKIFSIGLGIVFAFATIVWLALSKLDDEMILAQRVNFREAWQARGFVHRLSEVCELEERELIGPLAQLSRSLIVTKF